MAFTIAFVPLITAGMAAAGLIMQGRAANAAGKFNAAVAEQNATVARQEAAMLSQQQDRENYKRLGAIRAAQGKSGGASDEGSVLDVIGDAVSQGELQKQYIARAGAMKARGYEQTATLDRVKAYNDRSAGYMAAGSTFLGGAASYSGSSGGRTLPNTTSSSVPGV